MSAIDCTVRPPAEEEEEVRDVQSPTDAARRNRGLVWGIPIFLIGPFFNGFQSFFKGLFKGPFLIAFLKYSYPFSIVLGVPILF